MRKKIRNLTDFLQKEIELHIFTSSKISLNGGNLGEIERQFAGVAELVDAQDLKSCGNYFPCRFESGPRYLYIVEQGS
jgi:hypothetical protein